MWQRCTFINFSNDPMCEKVSPQEAEAAFKLMLSGLRYTSARLTTELRLFNSGAVNSFFVSGAVKYRRTTTPATTKYPLVKFRNQPADVISFKKTIKDCQGIVTHVKSVKIANTRERFREMVLKNYPANRKELMEKFHSRLVCSFRASDLTTYEIEVDAP